MIVGVKVDAARTSEQFAEARRDLNRRTKEGLIAAGEKVALPAARRYAGNLKVGGISTASTLTVRSTSRTAYLTTRLRGTLNRAVGLQERGGTVRAPILPRRAQAILTPWGPRAYVKGARTYKGRYFLADSVEHNTARIEEAIETEVLKAYDGLEVHR